VDRCDADPLGVQRVVDPDRMPVCSIVPWSAVTTPERTLTRVDLPAPLSPTSATTSPRRRSRLTRREPGPLVSLVDISYSEHYWMPSVPQAATAASTQISEAL
jgi:hypothetical protein